MQHRMLPLIAAAFLGGCAQVASEVCPPLQDYSQEIQKRAADELDALPADSVLADLIADYAVTRAALRAGGC